MQSAVLPSVRFVVDPSRSRIFWSSGGLFDLQPERDIEVVTVEVAKIESAWRGVYGCYISPGGGAWANGSKYQRARSWLTSQSEVWVPLLLMRALVPGVFSFSDGRHTFAALRDLGFQAIQVGVPRDCATTARQLIGPR
jgi:hypothetical protein